MKRAPAAVLGCVAGLSLFLAMRMWRGAAGPSVAGSISPPLGEVLSESGRSRAVALAESVVLQTRDALPPVESRGDQDVAVLPAGGDDEWSQMRVESFSASQYLVTSAAFAPLKLLMRHVELNPRDKYITPERRNELKALLVPMRRTIKPLLNAQHDMAALEMTDMINRGGTHTSRVAEGGASGLQAGMLPEGAGGSNVFRRVGDTIHMANRDNMPGSAIAEQLMHAKNAEIACAIAAWFYKEGTLTPDELHRLLARLGQPVTWNGK